MVVYIINWLKELGRQLNCRPNFIAGRDDRTNIAPNAPVSPHFSPTCRVGQADRDAGGTSVADKNFVEYNVCLE